jgi:hypothetical protein
MNSVVEPGISPHIQLQKPILLILIIWWWRTGFSGEVEWIQIQFLSLFCFVTLSNVLNLSVMLISSLKIRLTIARPHAQGTFPYILNYWHDSSTGHKPRWWAHRPMANLLHITWKAFDQKGKNDSFSSLWLTLKFRLSSVTRCQTGLLGEIAFSVLTQ